MNKTLTLVLCLLFSSAVAGLVAASTLIDPNGAGGFELGTTFAANGWTTVDGSSDNRYWLGNQAGSYAGSRCAFIAGSQNEWETHYNSSVFGWRREAVTAYLHIYRDISFPAGENQIDLSFWYKLKRTDLGVDGFRIYLANTSYTPGTSGLPTGTGIVQIGNSIYDAATSWTQESISIPAQFAGTTKRLIFTWYNDNSTAWWSLVGLSVGALDNISLSSSYSIGAPVSISASSSTYSRISLAWQKSSAEDDVILAYSSDGIFGNPADGQSYVNGDGLNGGGTIIYQGPATSFNHSGLFAGATHYYKLWTKKEMPEGLIYSSGIQANVSTLAVDNPSSFDPLVLNSSSISLSWEKNQFNNNVLLAWSTDGVFGVPQNGTSYSTGDPISGGGNVLYKGSDTQYLHSGLIPAQTIYYKIWSFGVDGVARVVYSSGTTASARTTASIRMMAEWETAIGVLIAYSGSFGLPYPLIADLSQRGRVYVVVSAANQATANNLLSSNGVNMASVSYINPAGGVDSYWIQDYGPLSVIDEEGNVSMVDFRYNRTRPNDDAVNAMLDDYFGASYSFMPLVATGGNVMTDGRGKMFSSDLILRENDGVQNSQVTEYNYNQSQINDLVYEYLGINDYNLLADPLAHSNIDHIDTWAKLLDVDKVMLPRVPSSHANYAAIEAMVDVWENMSSSYGTPYRIYRVNTPNNEPYLNSFIFNNKIYVPQTSASANGNDTAAIHAYQNAMPEYTVAGYYHTNWLSDDAIHCRVRQVYDTNMLQLWHLPVREIFLGQSVQLTGTLYNTRPLDPAGSFVRYRYYLSDQDIYTDWQSTALTVPRGEWTVTLDAPPAAGDSLLYYVQAADIDGRVRTVALNGASDPYRLDVKESYSLRIRALDAGQNPALGYQIIKDGTPLAESTSDPEIVRSASSRDVLAGLYSLSAAPEGYRWHPSEILVEPGSFGRGLEHVISFELLDDTLPVELSSFTAQISAQQAVQLHWITQSETNCSGYQIYRNTTDDLATAIQLNAFVEATNTSQAQAYAVWDRELMEDGLYYYWLQSLDLDGSSQYFGPVTINVILSGDGSPQIPIVTGINRIYPNPFNPLTQIEYAISEQSDVSIKIYNQRGQLVRNLISAPRARGVYKESWDARDDRGRQVGSGIYFIRMQSRGESFTEKAILLK